MAQNRGPAAPRRRDQPDTHMAILLRDGKVRVKVRLRAAKTSPGTGTLCLHGGAFHWFVFEASSTTGSNPKGGGGRGSSSSRMS